MAEMTKYLATVYFMSLGKEERRRISFFAPYHQEALNRAERIKAIYPTITRLVVRYARRGGKVIFTFINRKPRRKPKNSGKRSK